MLENKIAMVTGAGSGIGKGIATRFLKAGATLVGVDLYADRLSDLRSEAKASGIEERRMHPFQGDVSLRNVVERLVSNTINEFGRIDILVNNAGGSLGYAGLNFVDTNKEQWDATVKTNLYTVLNCTKAVLPHMIRQKYGKIINIGSITGMGDSVDGGDTQSLYAVSKSGVIMFTRALAREVARYGINVNCISPGVVRTRVYERIPRDTLDALVAKSPLGRVGEPEDIANVALFLVSESGYWLTGQNICASGGLVMH